MVLVRMLYFCAVKFDINVHIADSNSEIANTFFVFRLLPSASTTGRTSPRCHPCMANPVLDGLFHEYQSLGVLYLFIEHTDLELDLINTLVANSTFSNSLLHHLHCVTSVFLLHNVYLTRSTWLGYACKTWREGSMISQMIKCCNFHVLA